MVFVVPYGLYAVRVRRISPVVEVVFEKCRAALSEVSKLDFLNMYLNCIFCSVSVYHDTEIRFVEEVCRAADVVQCRGFDNPVLIARLFRGVCHQDNQQVVALREVCQLIEQLANVLCFIPCSLFAFKSVVRVYHEGFNATPPHEVFGFFENIIYSVVIRRGDEVKVLLDMLLHLLIFAECK